MRIQNYILFISLVLIHISTIVTAQLTSKEHSEVSFAVKNNPGQPANNFNYTTPIGKKNQLYNIKAKYTLLFFYNPECEACKEYKEMLASSNIISAATKKGTLNVLAIYIDKDISTWKKHLPEMPKTWIQGRDINEYLYRNNIYDLHAIPTLYLLDKNKRVILKDVLDVRMIEKALIK